MCLSCVTNQCRAQSQYAARSTSAVFRYQYDGPESGTLTWTFNSETILTYSFASQSVLQNVDESKYSFIMADYSLRISPVEIADEGLYQCRPIFGAVFQINLYVYGEFFFIYAIIYLLNSLIKFHCLTNFIH